MKLCFDSIAEVREFVAALKGTRGKRGENEDADPTLNQAPAPIQPPPQNANAAFAPQPQPTFTPPQGGFLAGAPVPAGDPAIAGLVARIVTRIDGAIASGQPADAVLAWFRGQAGPEAANATMDQIKQHFLPKLPMPSLENIAKLMNA